jgi:hypothetical protein
LIAVTKQNRLRALHNQVRRLQRGLERLERTSYRYSWARIAIFVVGSLVAGAAFYWVGLWLCGLGVALAGLLFGVAVHYHRQVDRSIARYRVWLQVKSAQIARAQLDWEHIPTTFGYQPQRDHPFETDLDLVGVRSLYRLLDTAVSYEGSQRLRAWLTTPIPDPQRIAPRQNLVRELIPLSLFREKLILNATMASGTQKTWEANQLTRWLERHAPEKTSLRPWLLLFGAFAGLNGLLFVAAGLGLLPPWWRVTLVIYLGLLMERSKAAGGVWEEAMTLQDVLRQLGAVFRQLETFSYSQTPHLRELCAPFLDRAHRPSNYLARIARVVAAMGLRANPLVWFVLNASFPWDFYFAHRLSQHKASLAQHAPAWMEAWFELEALGSLANFAYLNPSYTFPDVLAQADQARPFVLRARGLGHPLIPDDEKVCNDLNVPALGQVTIVTGSNMAGKSVFLKTVGMNVALACAGGPVNASSLQTLPFRLFACIGVSDSVTSGISYFYAEVKRLKALLTQLERDHPLPLLFFIDEIFRGTNNRERLIGSRAYVRALAAKHGVGFIATHDLELAKLADQSPQVKNYHFRDHVVANHMAFDYTLRPGPCPTTNALKIMQLEGLPVQLVNGVQDENCV